MDEIKQEIQLDPANSFKKEAIPILSPIVSEIQNQFLPLVPPISIIQDITENAIILPAILERVIEKIFE